mmetsp:Transcript_20585/g.46233  ORF Transcript_20585/g.46233 Transcript_20585/m.46233 type:complete len:90 (+) Transcript_20585:715-984(+)
MRTLQPAAIAKAAGARPTYKPRRRKDVIVRQMSPSACLDIEVLFCKTVFTVSKGWKAIVAAPAAHAPAKAEPNKVRGGCSNLEALDDDT